MDDDSDLVKLKEYNRNNHENTGKTQNCLILVMILKCYLCKKRQY